MGIVVLEKTWFINSSSYDGGMTWKWFETHWFGLFLYWYFSSFAGTGVNGSPVENGYADDAVVSHDCLDFIKNSSSSL